MTTQIWIEPVKRPDGRAWYTDRGLLLRSRLGGREGEILSDRVHNALCESCRVLMSRGVTGRFETWKPGIGQPCMTGDIERAAGLTVLEPDHGMVHFAKWRPFDQNAVSRSAVPSPAREDDAAERGIPIDATASVCSDRHPEAVGPGSAAVTSTAAANAAWDRNVC